MKELLSTREAAAYLGVSRSMLARLDIPRLRLGHRTVRYRLVDIEAYLESKRAA